MSTFQGPEEDFIGASIFVNVTVFSSGATLSPSRWLRSGHRSYPAWTFHPCDHGLPPSLSFLTREMQKCQKGWKELRLCFVFPCLHKDGQPCHPSVDSQPPCLSRG